MRSFFTLALTLTLTPSSVAGSSSSLLDVSADGRRMLVANTDSGTVTIVDLASGKAVAEVPAGDHPEAAAWAGDSGVATVYGDDTVIFIDPSAGKLLHTLKVDDEPYGIVTTKDGKTAYVTHDYPGTVSVIDVPGRKVVRTHKVGNGVRGLALANDAKTLFVTEFFT
ncbi:MAG: YncE family protein, partial [Fimbriiglobus sp.]